MAGTIVHFELPSAEVDRASGFCGGPFGWQIGASVMGDFDYRMLQAGAEQGGAIAQSDQTGSSLDENAA